MATTRTVSRCSCGARKSRAASYCRKCEAARADARHAEARAVVATGKCPSCGAGLRRNLSLTGWWQCQQYGAVTHRADPTAPACSWQTFTA
jgi:uncharacterized protein YbbK (DUF523 family)